MSETKEHKLDIRNLTLKDYNNIKVIMDEAYENMEPWTLEEYKKLLTLFPQGQICIEDNGKVVAAALALIIDYSELDTQHSYEDIVGTGEFKGHDPKGDYLYGIDVFVKKTYRGLRLGRRLYDARKELCETLNLKGIIAGGRIPGYSKYKNELTPKQYIEKVKKREIIDPVLTFQMANDFHPQTRN